MSKSVITIISAVFVILGSVIAYNFLIKGQEDTNLDLRKAQINNTASFLWVDKKQDERTFTFSGIEMQRIPSDSNPYFEMIFKIKDVETNNDITNGFKFSPNVGPDVSKSPYKLKFSYEDFPNQFAEIEVKLTVNTDIVDEGNYFLDVELNNGTFNSVTLNNGVDVQVDLEVNEKPPPLKIWINILIVILLMSLAVWFLLLKKVYYPTFSKKGQLNISEPEASTIFIKKNARKLIIGNKIQEKENFFTKLFCGKIQYELVSSNHSILITPYRDWKTKKIRYRLICKDESRLSTVSAESHMQHLDEYTIKTNDESLLFQYFNIKHF